MSIGEGGGSMVNHPNEGCEANAKFENVVLWPKEFREIHKDTYCCEDNDDDERRGTDATELPKSKFQKDFVVIRAKPSGIKAGMEILMHYVDLSEAPTGSTEEHGKKSSNAEKSHRQTRRVAGNATRMTRQQRRKEGSKRDATVKGMKKDGKKPSVEYWYEEGVLIVQGAVTTWSNLVDDAKWTKKGSEEVVVMRGRESNKVFMARQWKNLGVDDFDGLYNGPRDVYITSIRDGKDARAKEWELKSDIERGKTLWTPCYVAIGVGGGSDMVGRRRLLNITGKVGAKHALPQGKLFLCHARCVMECITKGGYLGFESLCTKMNLKSWGAQCHEEKAVKFILR